MAAPLLRKEPDMVPYGLCMIVTAPKSALPTTTTPITTQRTPQAMTGIVDSNLSTIVEYSL